MPDPLPPTRWELHFETTSPLFLGGAAPNEQAELRVPSIRGALRAWYRLIVGPKIAARGLENGRFAESSIFGGTARGEGQGRLVLRLVDPPGPGVQKWDAQSRGKDGPGSGRAYLGYTLNMRPNDRKAIPAGVSFQVRSVHPHGLPDDEGALLLASWWMLSTLGGLGTRSRRGLGSLSVTRWPPEVGRYDGRPVTLPGPALPDLRAATGKAALAKGLADGLFAIWDKVRPRGKAAEDDWELSHPAYRIDPKTSRFIVWGPEGDRGWRDGWEALDAVGRAMSGFRKQPGVDGLGASTLGTLMGSGTLPKAPARAGFGLPLTYRDLKSGRSYELRPHVATRDGKPERSTAGRMPSPLLISMQRTNGGVFAILTRLSGDLPGANVDLAVHGRDRGFIPMNPSIQAVDRFLDGLSARKEVRL